jgi:hypothetical protein
LVKQAWIDLDELSVLLQMCKCRKLIPLKNYGKTASANTHSLSIRHGAIPFKVLSVVNLSQNNTDSLQLEQGM